MPGSYHYFKNEVKEHLVSSLPSNTKFLDVGPGYGTYAVLLRPEFVNIDAVEIWEPYVEKFNLKSMYKNIYIDDIVNFKDIDQYNYIILGDVLEHISVENSQKLLQNITSLGVKCLVAVPYMYPQGEHDGNIYESHLQPDLTHELFLKRYPQMKELFRNEFYGYYINY